MRINAGKLVLAQVMGHLPPTTFRRCVARYRGERKVKRFSRLDHYLCMAFAQLTCLECLRDIEVCLRTQRNKLYQMEFRSAVSRNTLAKYGWGLAHLIGFCLIADRNRAATVRRRLVWRI